MEEIYTGKLTIDGLFEMLILLVFLGALLPMIMTSVFGMNTSGWDSGTIALWGLVGLVIVAGIIIAIKKNLFGGK